MNYLRPPIRQRRRVKTSKGDVTLVVVIIAFGALTAFFIPQIYQQLRVLVDPSSRVDYPLPDRETFERERTSYPIPRYSERRQDLLADLPRYAQSPPPSSVVAPADSLANVGKAESSDLERSSVAQSQPRKKPAPAPAESVPVPVAALAPESVPEFAPSVGLSSSAPPGRSNVDEEVASADTASNASDNFYSPEVTADSTTADETTEADLVAYSIDDSGTDTDADIASLENDLASVDDRREQRAAEQRSFGVNVPTVPLPDPQVAEKQAQSFRDDLAKLDNLNFQVAEGYWSNRYLPGDPLMRVLSARLARLGNAERLERIIATTQNRQPFDPPQNAALALYVAADHAAVEAPTRLRLQVGLQGTARLGGQRPRMNLAIVLDLRHLDDSANASAARALLLELARLRQTGDHFSLLLSGQPGVAVPPEQFRFGALQLALEQLPTRSPAGLAPLQEAIHTAAVQLVANDDPEAPLGSSMVLLLSADPLSQRDPVLEAQVHYQAVDGIGLSIIGIGQGPDPSVGEALVLAGQGQRWLLRDAAAAATLAEDVVFAASRAVARAVRLSIALAPGVQLVEVLGARRLAEPQAQRVRDAEQQIDLRMARNLGIRADRGEDEQGIQIVIPHYYAASSHVVLLDVVVPGPGAVADVSLRYKDLVYGRNGVAQAQLSLPSNDHPPGPLQHNVLKNRLTHEIATLLRQAGEALAAKQPHITRERLTEGLALLSGMQQSLPAWQQDQELIADRELLRAALAALQQHQPHLNSALRLAAYRRLNGQIINQ